MSEEWSQSSIDKETVAVLGCGPAGLLAAHALSMSEQPFLIISRKEKSPIGGAQFLHAPIIGITDNDPDAEVQMLIEGTADGYREKVYGKNPAAQPSFVSFPVEDRIIPAWNMQAAYDKLWETYGFSVNDEQVTPQRVDELLERFKFVVCTIPLHRICYTAQGARPGQCRFTHVTIRITQGTQDHLPDDTILYNGTDSSSWARASKLFGHSFAEYGAESPIPPGYSAVEVAKPMANTCNCWDQRNLLRAGRMGEWKKGVLVHHAFNDTVMAAQVPVPTEGFDY